MVFIVDGNIANIDDISRNTEDNPGTSMMDAEAEPSEKPSDKLEVNGKTPIKKRKRTSWQRGLLKKKKRRILNNSHIQVSNKSI